MIAYLADPGSFRDPGGRIYHFGDRVYRAVMPSNTVNYERSRDAGLLARLADKGWLVGSAETGPPADFGGAVNASHFLEHPRLPFISYPYEWSFSLLKSAALHHLDVQLEALAAGFTLSDASAYNVQFDGVRPIFIDHLSFRPYREGEVWIGHNQFCMQFLNPLIVWSRLGIAPNSWYRGSLEGLAPDDVSKLLSWRHNLSWTVFAHVTAQAAVQRRRTGQGLDSKPPAERRLSHTAFKSMLVGLRQFIQGCRVKNEKTVWSDYAGDNSYRDAEAAAKRTFVAEMAAATQPGLLLDLGCNSGDYSVAALDAGARRVIGFDYDFGALELAFRRARDLNLAFTPLWLDAANPSPAQGWAQSERMGLAERAKADALIALAFIHHIVIGRNVPLEMALDWLVSMAPVGVIEFPPKTDPMVQRLLATREDIFPDYTEENFLAILGARARVVKTAHLSPGGRILVWYDRSAARR